MEDHRLRVDEVRWIPDTDVVHFTIVICTPGLEKTVSFMMSLLEDTESSIVDEMKEDLKLSDAIAESARRLLEVEVERIEEEKEEIVREKLLLKAQSFHKEMNFEEAERLYTLLLDSFYARPSPVISPTNIHSAPTSPALSTFPSPAPPSHSFSIRGHVLFSLGHINYKLRKYSLAEHFYNEFLEGEGKAQGEFGREYLKTIVGLAKVKSHQYKYKEAEALLKKVYSSNNTGQKKVDKEVIEYAKKNLIKIFEMQAKYYESEMLFKRPLDELTVLYQKLESEGEKMMQAGEESLMAAQRLFKDALALKEESLPLSEELAEMYVKHNKFKEALECLQMCLELKEKLKDPGHYSLAETLCRIGKVLKAQGKLKEAEETMCRAAKLAEIALQSNRNLVTLYKKQANNNNSTQLQTVLARDVEIRKALINSLENLFEFYDQTGNKESAISTRKKKDEIQLENS
eukprot:TRINITY_DN1969_c0_g1_i1.p1 TRINITY_DN1969_c0_g1~~TRINITY_DN1969_c0_g1_i1.p1  ORF type:complete len:459 (+),score=152.54 TRINITY_DN1969_c0_g1_i1:42-1418(+)